jgi:hypothetical protein
VTSLCTYHSFDVLDLPWPVPVIRDKGAEAAVTKNTSGIKSHASRYQYLLRFSTAAVMNVENKEQIRLADEALLASLGYKQEFKRAFTPLEVGVAASLCCLTLCK